jgi:hypothetical protein
MEQKMTKKIKPNKLLAHITASSAEEFSKLEETVAQFPFGEGTSPVDVKSAYLSRYISTGSSFGPELEANFAEVVIQAGEPSQANFSHFRGFSGDVYLSTYRPAVILITKDKKYGIAIVHKIKEEAK